MPITIPALRFSATRWLMMDRTTESDGNTLAAPPDPCATAGGATAADTVIASASTIACGRMEIRRAMIVGDTMARRVVEAM